MKLFLCVFCLFAVACGSPADTDSQISEGDESAAPSEVAESETAPPPGFPESHAERPEMSAEQCAEANAEVVGDIGDGSTHRPDYVCPSGAAPIGTVALGIEGAVCCPL